ncbi:MAG: hypothetical protein QM811_03185 [Pirellulales bacterium]
MNQRWPLPVLVFLTGATAAVFLVMALVTTPRLTQIVGMPLFGGRLEGYDTAALAVVSLQAAIALRSRESTQ